MDTNKKKTLTRVLSIFGIMILAIGSVTATTRYADEKMEEDTVMTEEIVEETVELTEDGTENVSMNTKSTETNKTQKNSSYFADIKDTSNNNISSGSKNNAKNTEKKSNTAVEEIIVSQDPETKETIVEVYDPETGERHPYVEDDTNNEITEVDPDDISVTHGGREVDNKDADKIVPSDYKTPEEKEAERQAEREQIKKEKNDNTPVSEKEVVYVPPVEVEIKDLVDENGNVIDDTDVAVQGNSDDYEKEEEEPRVEEEYVQTEFDYSGINLSPSGGPCAGKDGNHKHCAMGRSGMIYIFCENVEQSKSVSENGVKYAFHPWIYSGFETEEDFHAGWAASDTNDVFLE